VEVEDLDKLLRIMAHCGTICKSAGAVDG